MNLTFKIGDTTLDNTEAKALLSASGKEPEIVVDIADHLDPTMFDAKKLFSMSVETKNPTLASLAARFAIEGINVRKKRTYNRSDANRLSRLSVKRTFSEPDEAIDWLCGMTNLKGIGAAMILDGVKDGYSHTLRDIATKCINDMAYRGQVSPDSQCFIGFCKNSDGLYQPLVQGPGVPRNSCYHSSAIYTAMRDGAQLLKESGLIDMSETIEFGSQDKATTENGRRLRRVVYSVRATAMGQRVAHEWGDIKDFIAHRWSARIRGRTSYAA